VVELQGIISYPFVVVQCEDQSNQIAWWKFWWISYACLFSMNIDMEVLKSLENVVLLVNQQVQKVYARLSFLGYRQLKQLKIHMLLNVGPHWLYVWIYSRFKQLPLVFSYLGKHSPGEIDFLSNSKVKVVCILQKKTLKATLEWLFDLYRPKTKALLLMLLLPLEIK